MKKIYTPNCLSKSTHIEYDLQKKEMVFLKENKIVFFAKSNLIEDRIQYDQVKKCLNRWGHSV